MQLKNKCIICQQPMLKKNSVVVTMFVCSERCNVVRKSKMPAHITPRCKEHWIKRGYSEEEAKQILTNNAKKTCKRCKEYWITRGYSEEEAQREVVQVQRRNSWRCVEHWIAKGYSVDQAREKISELQQASVNKKLKKYSKDDLKKQNSFSPEYWVTKGMPMKKAKEYCREKSDNMSLTALTNKFGKEKGLEKYKTICATRKQSYTLAGYIQQYGLEEGEKRWQKRFTHRPNSKKAMEFFNCVLPLIPANYCTYSSSTLGTCKGEYGIRDGNNYYFCDFVVPELKLCIEYFGDYWHCNPKKYDANYLNKKKKLCCNS